MQILLLGRMTSNTIDYSPMNGFNVRHLRYYHIKTPLPCTIDTHEEESPNGQLDPLLHSHRTTCVIFATVWHGNTFVYMLPYLFGAHHQIEHHGRRFLRRSTPQAENSAKETALSVCCWSRSEVDQRSSGH